ncbi:MAG: CoA-binding protein [Alphaproteobacteria bacterium]
MIGASPNPARDSYEVMRFLQSKGHRVIPVNPTAAGQSILGESVVADLSDIDGPVQMVDVFRRSEWVAPLVDDVLEHAPRLGITSIWMQLGVRDDKAAVRAEAAGIDVVMNRCPVIEYPRLSL